MESNFTPEVVLSHPRSGHYFHSYIRPTTFTVRVSIIRLIAFSYFTTNATCVTVSINVNTTRHVALNIRSRMNMKQVE